ncbi:TetR/AcrR family transcriptional regulator [Diplocloster modestus]|uniref:TetR/AcrR family transcriptional regulator n=1 Tax=Diplocloster modestus TaxID=2850322 RepID=A0ABS6K2X8_9FIRM|nr:TetR/AcrR family transcriptional regulator [Diplocloster modestus]MBU9724848.1 TetR/AcrR family transcriptional regulator [Diplocloster modestus]
MEVSAKKIALFDAVIALIEDGVDINTLKVSDITNRAGIGKGTAYEYFRSKEEIIIQALFYDVGQRIEKIRRLLRQYTNTKDRIHAVFQWIETDARQKSSFTQLFRMANGSFEFSNSLKEEMARQEGYCKEINDILTAFVEAGVAEGVFRREISPVLQRTALLSQIMSFMIYFHQEDISEAVTVEEMKDFLYENIMRMLG